jgi:hypothetical protein
MYETHVISFGNMFLSNGSNFVDVNETCDASQTGVLISCLMEGCSKNSPADGSKIVMLLEQKTKLHRK